MKSNKEYHFKNNIESVAEVVYGMRDAGYAVSWCRKCDLTGRTINYRIAFPELEREYEVTDLEDCLKFIVNDAVLLANMIKVDAITED